MEPVELREATDELIDKVLASSIEVHRELGPGLLESVYENAILVELEMRGIEAKAQVPISVTYKGVDLGVGFRADVIVENSLLLELKSVEEFSDIHLATVINYLKLLKFKRGFLLNFNKARLKDGMKRVSI